LLHVLTRPGVFANNVAANWQDNDDISIEREQSPLGMIRLVVLVVDPGLSVRARSKRALAGMWTLVFCAASSGLQKLRVRLASQRMRLQNRSMSWVWILLTGFAVSISRGKSLRKSA